MNVKSKDLKVIGRNAVRLEFSTIDAANGFLANNTLLDILDIDTKIPSSLIFKHGVVYEVNLDMPEEEILYGIDPRYQVTRIYRMTKAVKQPADTFTRVHCI